MRESHPPLPYSLSPVGVRDLFWMPIEQYRRDGRIIRGLQRGAASFGTSTASAALELSNRLVQAIQVLTRALRGTGYPAPCRAPRTDTILTRTRVRPRRTRLTLCNALALLCVRRPQQRPCTTFCPRRPPCRAASPRAGPPPAPAEPPSQPTSGRAWPRPMTP